MLWGANDALIPLEYGKAFEAQIERAKLATLPRAGHFSHLENRTDASRLTLEFLG